MSEERRGKGLHSGLRHGGHSRSSLWDKLTCCRVWSLLMKEKHRRITRSQQLFSDTKREMTVRLKFQEPARRKRTQ